MLYVLNAPVLTDWGVWGFRQLTLDEAKCLIDGNDFVSAVGHEATAQVLTEILGVNIPANRVTVRMAPGDKAIVFRVLQRLPEGAVLGPDEIKQVPYVLGLLERIE